MTFLMLTMQIISKGSGDIRLQSKEVKRLSNIIENGIVPIFRDSSGLAVDARALHEGLKVGRDFSNWIKDKFQKYGFVQGEDYTPILANRSDGLPGKPRIEYALTLDCAKEIAMTENTEQGRAVRRYFIEAEKRLRNQPVTVLDSLECMVHALRQQDERLKALETSNQEISDSVETIQQAVVFHPDDWRNNVNRMLNHIVKCTDNAHAYQRIRAALYEELERRAHCDLNRRLDNYRTRMVEEGCTKTAVKAANRLDVIEQDPHLREIFLSIAKEAVVRSGVSAKKH